MVNLTPLDAFVRLAWLLGAVAFVMVGLVAYRSWRVMRKPQAHG